MLNFDQMTQILDQDSSSASVIFPCVGGEDLLSNFDNKPSRWIIKFSGLSHDQASQYSGAYAWTKEHVFPLRQSAKSKALSEKWWLYEYDVSAIYQNNDHLTDILVGSQIGKYIIFDLRSKKNVFLQTLNIFLTSDTGYFAVMQSSIHDAWGTYYASSLETRLLYATTNCFETFPFPAAHEPLTTLGRDYLERRNSFRVTARIGLTKIYNKFHDPQVTEIQVVELRRIQVDMDQAVCAAYGWQDIGLDHGFHETKQGIRYTISGTARSEVLARLLALNHLRHAEEQAKQAAQPATKPTKRSRKPKDADNQVLMDL